MTKNNRIAVILGSIRKPRMNDRVATWVVGQLEARGFEIETIDPRDPELLPLQTGDKDAQQRLKKKLAEADGFVIVSPEYNHSMPGPLKTLIDSVGEEWKARPVGLISYGGISGGLRASEALRLVFAELHAVTLRDTVSFVAPWSRFDDKGQIINPDDEAAAIAAIGVFAQRLHWWSSALADARAVRRYDSGE